MLSILIVSNDYYKMEVVRFILFNYKKMKRLITYHWQFQGDDYVMEQEIIECNNCYCLPDEITRFLREKENSEKSTAKLWHCQIDKIEYLDEVWNKIKKMVMQEELSKYED